MAVLRIMKHVVLLLFAVTNHICHAQVEKDSIVPAISIIDINIYGSKYFSTYSGDKDTTIRFTESQCISGKIRYKNGRVKSLHVIDHGIGMEEKYRYRKHRKPKYSQKATWANECIH